MRKVTDSLLGKHGFISRLSECHSQSKLDLPSVKEHPSYLTFVLEKYQKGTLFHEPQAKTNMNGISKRTEKKINGTDQNTLKQSYN